MFRHHIKHSQFSRFSLSANKTRKSYRLITSKLIVEQKTLWAGFIYFSCAMRVNNFDQVSFFKEEKNLAWFNWQMRTFLSYDFVLNVITWPLRLFFNRLQSFRNCFKYFSREFATKKNLYKNQAHRYLHKENFKKKEGFFFWNKSAFKRNARKMDENVK